VLDVILRKAEAIRKATGVTVPLPDERGAITGALMNAVLLRKGRTQQLSLDLGLFDDAASMETRWRDAEEGERRSRARFAQNAIKPEEVIPEWRHWRELLGDPGEVRRFVERAMSRFDAPLEGSPSPLSKAHLAALPVAVRERLAARGLEGSIRLVFEEPAPAGTEVVVRIHPFPATLAEALLEGALNPGSSLLAPVGRTGAWSTSAVPTLTTVALLRLRFKLTIRGRRERLLLVEEASAVAFEGGNDAPSVVGEAARKLLELEASGNLAGIARERIVTQARQRIEVLLNGSIAAYAHERAISLAEDHARVRASGVNVPRVTVDPVLPADVVGLFVLIPGGV